MQAEWVQRLQARYAQLNARERRVVVWGGIALAILLAYGAVYEPIQQARAKLEQRLPTQRADLRLLRAQVAEIEQLRTRAGKAGEGTLEQRIKASAAAFGVADTIAQFTVLSPDQIQIITRPLPASTWIGWLADLERNGVAIVRYRVKVSDPAGTAGLELTLAGGGA